MAKKEEKAKKVKDPKPEKLGKKARAALREEILHRTLARWLEVEEETIASADKLMSASKSLLVQQMMNLVRRDSEKHREMLQTINAILEGTITMTPEELGEISELLEHHKQIENESIVLARTAMENTRHFVIRQMLQYMLEDERKHLTMTNQVSEYKQKMV